MRLSEFEKEIVISISKNKIKNYQMFFDAYFENGTFQVHQPIPQVGANYVDKMVLDPERVMQDSASFLVFIQKMKEIKLIFPIENGSTTRYKYFLNSGHNIVPFRELEGLIKERDTEQYYPTGDLIDFIRNDFRTNEEVFRENEARMQNRSYKLTRTIGYFSIGVSVLLTFINLLTYSINRKVEITNTQPTKVEVINPELKKVLSDNKLENSDSRIEKLQITKK